MKKLVKNHEIPDSFFEEGVRVEAIADLRELANLYGYATAVEDETGNEGIVIYIPSYSIDDILPTEDDKDEDDDDNSAFEDEDC